MRAVRNQLGHRRDRLVRVNQRGTRSERDELWEINASWWIDGFTDGADPEYEEQIIPMASERFAGITRLLDIGTGDGQLARVAARQGIATVGVDPTHNQVVVAHERGGGPVYARTEAAALPFADGAFDGVLACLVFEHISAVDQAIAEVARVLRPGGRFLFFLNHPLLQTPGSGWIDDHIIDEQYWRIGPYLIESDVIEEVEKNVFIPFVHRPISRYVNAMAANGLFLTEMQEPAPPTGFLDKAAEYGEADTIPRLLLLHARKG
jgi:SAM-dependent methyltransferase